MKNKLINFIASGFWISRIPAGLNSYKKFKGTGLFGTILAFILAPFLPRSRPVLFFFLLFFSLFSIWISGKAFPDEGENDNPLIVIDEICGYWVSLFFVSREPKYLLIALVLFRIFDTLKPWPIKKIESSVKGGTGIVLDDLFAGTYAGVLTFLLSKFI